MNPEIENLINMALADGEVTEKERAIILRKAEALGLDRDEVEMILDGKIAIQKKELSYSQSSKENTSNKAGDIKKCPSCGAPVQAFVIKCSDCGHEFRNIEAVSSIKALHLELQKGEEDERNKPRSWAEKMDGELAVAKAVANRQKSIIASFPVPNAKEDLLEFLSIANSEASKKLGFFIASVHPEAVLKNAWKAKCEQLIIKSRLTFNDDKKALEEIENYAKKLGIK
jgi:hypothetical protein